MIRSGSLVFLLSDFAAGETDPAWMASLGRRCELVAVYVHDALEAAPPPAALYPVSVDGECHWLDASAASTRSRWLGRHEAHLQRLEANCRIYRAHLVSLRTDQPVGPTLRDALDRRPRLAAAAP